MRKRLLNRITYITAVFCMLAALFYCPTAVYAAALAGNIQAYRPFHYARNHRTVFCKPRKAPADDAVYSRKLQKKSFPG